jgi:prepilin-type N-terminal cleavage/methylation domain-containing protein
MEALVMLRIVLKDKKGVTLVEVLIALVILLIVFLGLIQASLLSIDTNAMNLLRDEAVRLASDTMISLRSSPFDDLNRDGATPDAANINFVISSTGTAAQQLNAVNLGINTQKTVRNILTANYVVTVTITDMDASNKQADVLVQWDYKERTLANGSANAHRVVSLLRRI